MRRWRWLSRKLQGTASKDVSTTRVQTFFGLPKAASQTPSGRTTIINKADDFAK